MAVKKSIKASKIQLRLDAGKNADGSAKYSTVTYNRVNKGATDEDVQAVGAALGNLQSRPVVDVLRVDEAALAVGE